MNSIRPMLLFQFGITFPLLSYARSKLTNIINERDTTQNEYNRLTQLEA